jgi:adenosylcobinamide-GDP ribazoletransferase
MIRRLQADEEPTSATAVTPAESSEPAEPSGPVGRIGLEITAATALLTRLPVGGRRTAATGSRAFAIVGAAIGAAACIPLALLGSTIPPVAAILAIAVMALLSGGLHLDGLADTADALIAVGPDAAERARKDPRIGVGGVTTLILVLGVEATSLTLLVELAGALVAGVVCVVAASMARAVPVILARLARGRTAGSGIGAWFAERTRTLDALVAGGVALAVAIAGTLVVPTLSVGIVGPVGAAVGVGLGLGLVRLRGQLDGDVLGASVELSFAAALVGAAAIAA